MTKPKPTSQTKPFRLNAGLASGLSIQLLREGRKVRIPAGGVSMYPYLRKGDLLEVEPVSPKTLKRGDIIVFQRRQQLIAHRLRSINQSEGLHEFIAITIGDACIRDDEPIHSGNYLGKVTAYVRKGHVHRFDAMYDRLYRNIFLGSMPLSNRLFFMYRKGVARIPKMLRNRLGFKKRSHEPAQGQF